MKREGQRSEGRGQKTDGEQSQQINVKKDLRGFPKPRRSGRIGRINADQTTIHSHGVVDVGPRHRMCYCEGLARSSGQKKDLRGFPKPRRSGRIGQINADQTTIHSHGVVDVETPHKMVLLRRMGTFFRTEERPPRFS